MFKWALTLFCALWVRWVKKKKPAYCIFGVVSYIMHLHKDIMYVKHV